MYILFPQRISDKIAEKKMRWNKMDTFFWRMFNKVYFFQIHAGISTTHNRISVTFDKSWR